LSALADGVEIADQPSLADEFRAWLADNWDPELSLLEWRDLLFENRWACPEWPDTAFGRGLGGAEAAALKNVLDEFGAVGPPPGAGMHLAAPTLLKHATPELLQRVLPGIATGRDTWCQLFSEPGSGSDLAGLTTSAVRDGDEWVVNGQKLWTTSADHATYAMLLARTDRQAPKHQGISYIVLPMEQEGITCRPVRQMNGYASFFEVFITDARAPVANTVGPVNGGWAVARTTLAHERGLGAMRRLPKSLPRGSRIASEAAAEAKQLLGAYKWYPQRAGRVDLLGDRTAGASDPVRHVVVDALARQKMAAWTYERGRVARGLGRPPGPESSLMKLLGTDLARRCAHAHSLLSGASAMLVESDDPLDRIIAEVILSVPAGSIAGGTDEVQKNLVAEKVLGLPRDVADGAASRMANGEST
jgi:alkylation response protein AidB-like acyl-CoA dehydrogenase